MLAFILLELSASAHYPHTVVEWAAVSPAGQLAAHLDRVTTHMVSLSENQQDWEVRYLGPGRMQYADGTWLSEEHLVVGTSFEGLWESRDRGATWQAVADLPAESMVSLIKRSPQVATDGIAFATTLETLEEERRGVLWRTSDGGDSWQTVLDGSELDLDVTAWQALDLSPTFGSDGRVCAMSDSCVLACSQDHGDSWTLTEHDDSCSGVLDLSLGPGDRVYMVSPDGLLRSPDGGTSWESLVIEGAGDPQLVVALSASEVLLADTHDVWRSVDGGDSWSEASEGLARRSDAEGGPADGLHLLDFERGDEGNTYMATWEGLYRTSGGAWIPLHTLPATLARGVAASPRSPGGAWVLLGTEGSGAILTDTDHGLAWPMGVLGDDADSLSLHLRGCDLSQVFEVDGIAAMATAWGVSITRDWGQTWRLAGSGSSPVDLDLSDDPLADPVLLAGGSDPDLPLQHLDGLDGELLASPANPPCEGGTGVVGQFMPWTTSASTLMAGCSPSGLVYASTNAGQTWTAEAQLSGESLFTMVRLPDDGETWVATSIGLYRLPADGDELELLAFEDEQVHWFALSPDFEADGTAFLVLAKGEWYRTNDGGESWQELDTPTPQVPWEIVLPADFAESGAVVVGTMDGAWASTDRGESWSWIWTLDRFEEYESSSQIRFHPDDAWELEVLPGASGGRVMRARSAGAEVLVDFEGIAAQLLMVTEPEGGRVTVYLDDEEGQTISLEGEEAGAVTAWEGTELEDGWHQLRVVTGDPGVRFDAVYGWHQLPDPEAPLPWEVETSEEPGDGGSDDSGGADSGTADGGSADGGSADEGSADEGSANNGAGGAGGCGCGGRGSAAGGVLLLVLAGLLPRRRLTAAG